ncbi:Hypothetical predicted protein [Olea europaea subsp. europaea]|uniref:Uncharacterized protein n=1 Tax=Olea europaea subsp. europaea TaxID=158383 RepID=A0A8S0UDU1_OLEEU|nr:Hypothetical predicted protein [Olea europaea subsp. europaea]
MGVVEFLCSFDPPSFDLGLGFMRPSQLEAMTSKEVQMYVDSIKSNVLKEAESTEQEISNMIVAYTLSNMRSNIGSMSMKLDMYRARLDIVSLLFRYREIMKATKKVQPTGGQIIVIQ